MKAYLVLVTWPDGSEGLLFPRLGNVPIAATEEQGWVDLATAHRHLQEYRLEDPDFITPLAVRLVVFERGETLGEFRR